MQRNIQELIEKMTLEEKAGLCSGLDFWHTKPVGRLGIPSIMMTDGPHGLRKQGESADHMGLNTSVPATCFPTASALACSFDTALIQSLGTALGEECQAENVSIILGPGANIKRSPLCGRNFEYLSEDPCLAGEMAAAYIEGVQSEGVGTSLKHFAANNMETNRMTGDSVVDERTLREVYLAGFEKAVTKAQPWTVMCAYNRLNGTFCSENSRLLTEILKEEWGHEGFVVSDWGAVNERPQGLATGMELEMPFSGGENDQKIVDAVKNGRLSEKALDKAVTRILKIVFRAVDSKKENAAYDREAHHALAKRIAEECAVLLKNEDSILPLKKCGKIGIIGGFAKEPRYQGGGSSHINPNIVDVPLDCIRDTVGGDAEILYAQGCQSDEKSGTFSNTVFQSKSDIADEQLIAQAVEVALKSDVAVIFAGLPESYESEGFDRQHMRLPDGQNKLIEAVCAAQKNTVLVLSNGSPIEMPWICSVKAVLECYLGGQAFGGAVTDLLFGIANPCGRLAESFPKKLSDNPSHLNFYGDTKHVEYREGLFVGYRYYDAKQIKPLFPFGYGLSYTTFEYADLRLDKDVLREDETLTVSLQVKNTGTTAGKEVVQLYVSELSPLVIRPQKELKGFTKVLLAPSEQKTVSFVLDRRAFAHYCVEKKGWIADSGVYRIIAAKSSAEPVLEKTVRVESGRKEKRQYDMNTTLGELEKDSDSAEVVIELMGAIAVAMGFPQGMDAGLTQLFRYSPLRQFVLLSGGSFSQKQMKALLNKLNCSS